MGGFTKILLKDTSEDNIILMNCLLDRFKVSDKYRFYLRHNAREEYYHYIIGNGAYPAHMFPRDKINSYEGFLQYWNPEKCGDCFVRPFGMLTFDCYFNRTPAAQMKRLAHFLLENRETIAKVGGSFETFVERAGISKKSQKELLKLI